MTAMRDRFAMEYVVDYNATQAAIRAGASPKTATKVASKWLTMADVQAKVAKAQGKIARRTELTQDDVVTRLAEVGFSDLTDIISWNQDASVFRVVATEDLPAPVRRAIKKIKVKRTRQISGKGADAEVWEVENIEIEMHDKLKALELVGRHIGMWPAKPIELNANVQVHVMQAVQRLSALSVPELLAKAAERAPLLMLPDPMEGSEEL